jgi:predicted membrane protein
LWSYFATVLGSPLNNELQEVAQERIWTSLETNSNYVQINIVHKVLFDMDGVLCDSKHYSWEIVIILFAKMSVTVTTTNVVIFMGIGRFFFFFFHNNKISFGLELCILSLSLLKFFHYKWIRQRKQNKKTKKRWKHEIRSHIWCG